MCIFKFFYLATLQLYYMRQQLKILKKKFWAELIKPTFLQYKLPCLDMCCQCYTWSMQVYDPKIKCNLFDRLTCSVCEWSLDENLLEYFFIICKCKNAT